MLHEPRAGQKFEATFTLLSRNFINSEKQEWAWEVEKISLREKNGKRLFGLERSVLKNLALWSRRAGRDLVPFPLLLKQTRCSQNSETRNRWISQKLSASTRYVQWRVFPFVSGFKVNQLSQVFWDWGGGVQPVYVTALCVSSFWKFFRGHWGLLCFL